ncbi:MAG: hypothetical protein AAGB11_11510 [Pseudomonadota bacterium]
MSKHNYWGLGLAVMLTALSMAACVNSDPNRQIDYSRLGFSSDDGSR